MRTRLALLRLVALSSVALWWGCVQGTHRNQSPNILLITIDTTRQDHLSLYGYQRNTSPVLSELALQGIRFDLAYAPSATTGPTHASLFTSLYPPSHGVIKNGLSLDEKYLTLAEILSQQGYQTAAVTSSFVLDSEFGYGQGFDFFSDELPLDGSTTQADLWEGHKVIGGFDRRADATTREAAEWLEEHRDPERPFFLFLHYFDPHSPYVPPEPLASNFAGREEPHSGLEEIVLRYDAEIAFADREIGNLLHTLQRLALEESTLVVITADHGEGLMQHGHLEHGVHIYEEAVRVPLMIRWKEHIEPGQIVSAPVDLIDLAPTLLGLAGLPPESRQMEGRNMASAIQGQEPWPQDHPVYLFRRFYALDPNQSAGPRGEKFGIRLGRWKYIVGPEEQTRELFDLESDPGETKNLVDDFPEERDRLARRLDTWLHSVRRADQEADAINDEDRARLEALGYVD